MQLVPSSGVTPITLKLNGIAERTAATLQQLLLALEKQAKIYFQ